VGTALEASPKLSGNLLLPIRLLVKVTPSCSTSLPPVNSLTQAKAGYTAIVVVALDLEVRIVMSLVHIINHLMVMESVDHGEMNLVTRLLLKVGRTC
jgi:hypothetical protein